MVAEAKRTEFYGWRLLLFLGIVMLAAGYNFYGPPVLFPMMIQETGWSRGEISLGLTVNLMLTGFAAPGVAWSIHRFGARLTLFAGGLIAAGGTLLAGLVGGFYPLYLLSFGVVTGTGLALGTALPTQTVVVFWFNRRRALALSLIMAGVALGGFIAPPTITAAVSAAGGNWRLGWLTMSLLMVMAALVAIVFVRNRPADMGQHPDGLSPEAVAVAVASGGLTTRTYRSPINWRLADVLRTRQFWLLGVAVVGSFFVWMTIISQGPLHLQDRGFDAPTVSLIYGMAVGLTMVGRLGAGILGDRVEPRIIFLAALGLALAGATSFWLASPQAIWAAWMFPLFSGVGAGAIIICMGAIIGNYWGPGAFPGVNGVITPLFAIFNSLAGPFAGFVYDTQGSYLAALLVAGVGLVVAFLAMLFCTPPRPQGAFEGALTSQRSP